MAQTADDQGEGDRCGREGPASRPGPGIGHADEQALLQDLVDGTSGDARKIGNFARGEMIRHGTDPRNGVGRRSGGPAPLGPAGAS